MREANDSYVVEAGIARGERWGKKGRKRPYEA